MRKVWILFFIALFAGEALVSGGLAGSQNQAKATDVSLHFRALFPGEVIKVSLKVEAPLRQAMLFFEGERYFMGREEGRSELLGFVGLDLNLKPGKKAIRISLVYEDGSQESIDKEILVQEKAFPVKKLWVKEEFVTPPASALERIRRESELLQAVYAIFTPHWLGEGQFILPAEGEAAPNFGERRVYNNKPLSSHSGVDISCPFGAAVAASNAGRVVLASDLYFSGKTVIIDHGLGVFSLYCHFSEIRAKRGDFVRKGEVIGEVGATGRATGPHLHWGFRVLGNRVDPLSMISLEL